MMQQPQVPFIPGPPQEQPPPLPPKQPSPVPSPRGVAGGNLPPGTPPTTALRDHGIKVLIAVVMTICDRILCSSTQYVLCYRG